jgi:hypothetical protein
MHQRSAGPIRLLTPLALEIARDFRCQSPVSALFPSLEASFEFGFHLLALRGELGDGHS